jgi:hypothetical protein
MFAALINYFRTLPQRQIVRPWAMATPILVLVVALPLLRPLRSPELSAMSTNELSRLASIQAMAEHHTQEIDRTTFFPLLRYHNSGLPADTVQLDGKYYSDKAPVLSAILAGDYIILGWFGLTMERNGPLVVYLLTILCSVVPVAAVGGMVYRMGRLFELRRSRRALLAMAVTFGSGLLSYAVVINAHAPAAALVLGACACLVHITVAKEPTRTGAWLMASGFCAALAAVIDPAATVFFAGLVLVIIALRWRKRLRFGGVILYGVGAVPVIMFHAVLTVPITGDLLPPAFHPEMQRRDLRFAVASPTDVLDDAVDDDPSAPPTWLRSSLQSAWRVLGELVGSRGIFSHFPVLIFGLLGIGAVLRRHWPVATKVLAAVTLAGGALIVIGQPFMQREGSSIAISSGAFGPRWFLVFLPLLLFWSGAWMRKQHHPVAWSLAGLTLAYSIAVSLIGTTAPFLVAPGQYSAAVALRQLIHPPVNQPVERSALASN